MRRSGLHVVLVNPIAVSPTLTPRDVLRPRLPQLGAKEIQSVNIVELGAQMAALGHETTVLLGGAYLGEDSYEPRPGLTVTSVPTSLPFPFHPGLLPFTPRLAAHLALQSAEVVQAAEFHQPATFFAARATRQKGIPLVIWQETFTPMRFPGSAYQRTYQALLGASLRGGSVRYVPRTTRAASYLQTLGVPGDAVAPWIPTGIDLEVFRPGTTDLSPEAFGWSPGDRILLLVARLDPSKGADLALRALTTVRRTAPDVRLLLVGAGPERARLERLAAELGVTPAARFLGALPREELLDVYRLADLVLCPSRNDLLPFALIEAGACGRPVVTRDVGAVRDVVLDGETGRVVQGVGELAPAVFTLLEDPDRCRTYGLAARNRMESYFDIRRVAKQLLEVYRGGPS